MLTVVRRATLPQIVLRAADPTANLRLATSHSYAHVSSGTGMWTAVRRLRERGTCRRSSRAIVFDSASACAHTARAGVLPRSRLRSQATGIRLRLVWSAAAQPLATAGRLQLGIHPMVEAVTRALAPRKHGPSQSAVRLYRRVTCPARPQSDPRRRSSAVLRGVPGN
jgi:hypothetical protein